ncbi:hypothetical protein EQO05_03740 [Methanosarcina sp. MSH10X1]|nr:hypothetical protein EQO05_03740 [Methanosarcina sp. MSH10X1]
MPFRQCSEEKENSVLDQCQIYRSQTTIKPGKSRKTEKSKPDDQGKLESGSLKSGSPVIG